MITLGFRNKFGGWLRSITAIVIGIIMVSKPETSLILTVKVLAAFLIASGIVSLVYGIINRFPQEVARFMLILIGIAVLIFGIMQIIVLVSASRVVSNGFLIYILPVLCVIGGALLLIKPFSSLNALVLLAGIAVLVYGVSEFIATWKINRAMKAYETGRMRDDTMKSDMSGVKDVDYEKVEDDR